MSRHCEQLAAARLRGLGGEAGEKVVRALVEMGSSRSEIPGWIRVLAGDCFYVSQRQGLIGGVGRRN